MTESTVTRRRSHRGQLVRVTLRDGRTVTGHLDGWGPQILAVRPTDGGLHGWKVESFGVSTVARVDAVPCEVEGS